MERSYPKGRTDLEFVGKYHEKFARIRMVIEFKYCSNMEFRKFKTDIEDCRLQQDDSLQIDEYVEGVKNEHPEARISRFVIYCFGNRGFRMFELSPDAH